jgi:homoserine kinase
MRVYVPATSANLGPGFDSLGLALDFHNEIKIKRSKFFSISIKGEGSSNSKLKKNNIFVNIFYDIYTKFNQKKDNFRFEFQNAIPLARGMGSSSAVIIGAIGAAYQASGLGLTKKQILNDALYYENHPDNITPATYGGFTSSIITSNQVIYQKKDLPSYLKAVMVIPNKAMSTAHSRTKLPKLYKAEDAIFNISRSSFLTASFFAEDWKSLKEASLDRFHQEYRMSSFKELFDVQKTALANGAFMSTLSGSGSSFFNLTHQDDTKRIKEILEKKFPRFRVKVLNFNNAGLEIKE